MPPTVMPKSRAVYPRACGGTTLGIHLPGNFSGLSPRLRGNLGHRTETALPGRSIPALAGEPLPGNRPGAARQVYPRACGGTYNTTTGQIENIGLSPRLRGNRAVRDSVSVAYGSIPALAGEPSPGAIWYGKTPVYPRACGGTIWHTREEMKMGGLSPRLRGNHVPGPGPLNGPRSIPALAGEPRAGPGHTRTTGVYPRACGGTTVTVTSPRVNRGLSPRLRGNPGSTCRHGRYGGSIPALAGEP